jgi:hypothetical protein
MPKLPALPAVAVPTDKPPAIESTKKSGKKTRKSASGVEAGSAAADASINTGMSGSADQSEEKKPGRAAALTSEQARGKAGSANKPRLKLEPLDLTIERDPQLKSSTELLSVPAATAQERSAAAALWRAITAQPQEVMKDLEKLQTLESSVRNLQAQGQKTQLSVNEMAEKLQKAESERYANPLVYALIFFLLLALAGLAYLMRHRFSGGRHADGDAQWWRKGQAVRDLRQPWADDVNRDGVADSELSSNLKKAKSKTPANGGQADAGTDLNSSRAELSASNQNFGFDSVSPLAPRDRPDFALSMTYVPRALKAEELFDVQQQADFFVSIGQHDQAIEVLRSSIGDDFETSALVYLDLFKLYHQLQRRDDYAELRDDFNGRFNIKIPEFDMYTDAGPGLDAYETAMSRIEALWPSPKVLELIEESIFRQPDENGEAFNLEAYRELLLLYSVAKEIISPEPKSTGKQQSFNLPKIPTDNAHFRTAAFDTTAIQPLSASIDDRQALPQAAVMEPLLASTIPPVSFNLGLDLDLSQPMSASEKFARIDALKQSDGEFFADFDKDLRANLTSIDSSQAKAKKQAQDSPNLIDFDPLDLSANSSEEFKLPKR